MVTTRITIVTYYSRQVRHRTRPCEIIAMIVHDCKILVGSPLKSSGGGGDFYMDMSSKMETFTICILMQETGEATKVETNLDMWELQILEYTRHRYALRHL